MGVGVGWKLKPHYNPDIVNSSSHCERWFTLFQYQHNTPAGRSILGGMTVMARSVLNRWLAQVRRRCISGLLRGTD